MAVLVIGAGAAWFVMSNRTGANRQQAAANHSAPIAAQAPATATDTLPAPSTSQEQSGLYQWATSTDALAVTPEFLAGKLGPARKNDGSLLDFSVAGSDIQYRIENKAVVYFDAEFSASCKPSLKG